MVSPMFVIRSKQSYFQALEYEAKRLQSEDLVFIDIMECFALLENAVFHRNHHNNSNNNRGNNAVTIVVSGEEDYFLEELCKLILGGNVKRPFIKLIIMTKLEKWSSDAFTDSVATLTDLQIQKYHNQEAFETERTNRILRELVDANMIYCHFVLYSNIYGGPGFDFSGFLWALWNNQDEIEFESFNSTGKSVACIYSFDLFQLLLKIHDGEVGSEIVVPAFEDPATCYANVLKQFCKKVNGDGGGGIITGNKVPLGSLLNSVYDPSLFQRYYKPLSSIIQPFDSNSDKLWDIFLHEHGLNPLNILVSGPPKSKKSEISKYLAEKIGLELITVQNSVLYAFQFDLQSAMNEQDSNINFDHLSQFKRELASAIEAKLIEQASAGKKGKDKAPAPGEIVVEPSHITEALCYTIGEDILRSSIALKVALDRKCKRKGFILDVWESNIYSKYDDLTSMESTFKHKDSQSSASFLFHSIIELQANAKALSDRQVEILGPQQTKSKEGQAMLKAYESSLESYFNTRTMKNEINGKEITSSIAFQNALSLDYLLKLFPAVLESGFNVEQLFDEFTDAYRNHYGRKIPWLPTQDKQQLDNHLSEEQKEFDEGDNQNSSASNVNGNQNNNASDSTKKLSLSEKDQQVVKYNEFLCNTILPTISSAMVQIIRECPQDPILFLADAMLLESQSRQDAAYSEAYKRFMELLNS